MAEFDQLSNQELAELAAELEREQEPSDAELLATIEELEASGENHEQALEAWQQDVTAFGGRVGSPVSKSLLQQLGDSQLGQSLLLPTSGSVPITADPILLAEMRVSKPIAVDVSFAYLNARPTIVSPALDQGDGYIQLTWGTSGTFQRTARVDGNRGWRFPFVASFLRVEYVPVDLDSGGGRVIPVNQPRDLGISAMIAPANGAPCLPLTRTVYFGTVAGNGSSIEVLPRWAKQATVATATEILAMNYTVEFLDSTLLAAEVVSNFFVNGTAGGFPRWQGKSVVLPIPQRAQTVRFTGDSAPAVDFFNASLICELAL